MNILVSGQILNKGYDIYFILLCSLHIHVFNMASPEVVKSSYSLYFMGLCMTKVKICLPQKLLDTCTWKYMCTEV